MTCQFDNPAYGTNVKSPEIQENVYSLVDESSHHTPCDGSEITRKSKHAEATGGPDANKYHSPGENRTYEEDLPGQLYDCIEILPVKHMTNKAATEEFSDDPVYDDATLPVKGAPGFTNLAYDC